MKRYLLAALLATSLPALASAPRPLASGDVKAFVQAPAQGVRIIAIWSLDCAYCEENLSALSAFQKQHQGVDLVFVATDPVSQRDALAARLKAAHLDGVPSRAYADATPDRINFMIDPEWGGETPRTLVIHADGSRKTYSGALNAARIASLVD